LIEENQYGLLVANKESSSLQMIKNKYKGIPKKIIPKLHLAHVKSDLRMMDFSQFCSELEKHILKQESKIDFDENFYIEANPSVTKKYWNVNFLAAMFTTASMGNMKGGVGVTLSLSIGYQSSPVMLRSSCHQ